PMRIRLLISCIVLLLAVGCSGAPVVPTLTPTEPPPTATDAPPTPMPQPTDAPPSPDPLAPTITVIAPSSFGGSALQSRIAFADEAECAGSVPREFALAIQRTDLLDVKLSCLKQMLQWETAAGEQQRILMNRDGCVAPPETISGADQRRRNAEMWALDDLTLAYAYVGNSLADAGDTDLATEAYETVIENYACGWIYDNETSSYMSALDEANERLAALAD
ncbi:MAG: hypothetical protein AAF125_11875, partial [Chloroflexota bacterium]